ncbi:Amino acid/polyamine transporter I [Macleaya cordata]|uniref:Amino acid/polyamine transporter I n=1 Tax=Macleaya cordata TaxID=56857 RepID=A0A200RAS1_MACCD|nr:Amino acid/polyamine transporter I [Macleaya cordata]
MLATWTPDEELNQVRLRSGSDMKRKLKWHDLIALGVGGMLGAGVFVTTGHVALKISGPAVFISYIIAGVSALLSSLCYTEFSVNIPVAGGAFSYLRVTFGEFVGYFAGLNILMEYVLSNAAVARSFTEYLCRAVGVDPDSWRVEVDGLTQGYNKLDFPAVALVLVLTLCLCHSTKESSILNLIMTVFHVIFFSFIVIAGFCNGSAKNLIKPKGLTPFGVRGVLEGSSVVYFSYIGYDSVSTTAEEIKNPSKSLPVGIIGSVVIVSVLYCLMALALCTMVPYTDISDTASFAFAFQNMADWKWAGNVVGAGACLGIVASLLVAMLGQARYLCVIGRARLVPVWLAKVHPSTGTPMNATLFLGICTSSIALFTDLSIVIEMISIGTLLVFYLVANALIYRRYVNNNNSSNNSLSTLLFLMLLSSSSIGFSVSWKLKQQWWSLVLFGGASITITAFFHYMVPCVYRPSKWSVPLMPWPAAASIFLNIFLMTYLKKRSFQRFGIWACVITLFYVLYGVHSTYSAEERDQVRVNHDEQVNPSSSSTQQTKIDIQLV